jgi:hypothetical protein
MAAMCPDHPGRRELGQLSAEGELKNGRGSAAHDPVDRRRPSGLAGAGHWSFFPESALLNEAVTNDGQCRSVTAGREPMHDLERGKCRWRRARRVSNRRCECDERGQRSKEIPARLHASDHV